MKKYVITCLIILLSIFIISSIRCISNAVGLNAIDIENPDPYIQSTEDNTGVIEIANIIVWAVRTVGESIAVIMLLIIGIKYVMASAEEKAEYKQTMWPYILGSILIFAGAEITNIIYQAFNT